MRPEPDLDTSTQQLVDSIRREQVRAELHALPSVWQQQLQALERASRPWWLRPFLWCGDRISQIRAERMRQALAAWQARRS